MNEIEQDAEQRQASELHRRLKVALSDSQEPGVPHGFALRVMNRIVLLRLQKAEAAARRTYVLVTLGCMLATFAAVSIVQSQAWVGFEWLTVFSHEIVLYGLVLVLAVNLLDHFIELRIEPLKP